jgi:hypothetical protein
MAKDSIGELGKMGDVRAASGNPPSSAEGTSAPNAAAAIAASVSAVAKTISSGEIIPVRKQLALEHLVAGKSMSEASRLTGIPRITIYRWLKTDPAFQAAFNEWHEQMENSVRARLMAMTDVAAEAVQKSLENGDARTAMQLLIRMGLFKEKPPGPTDADEVAQRMEMDKKLRGKKLNKAKMDVEFFL